MGDDGRRVVDDDRRVQGVVACGVYIRDMGLGLGLGLGLCG